MRNSLELIHNEFNTIISFLLILFIDKNDILYPIHPIIVTISSDASIHSANYNRDKHCLKQFFLHL